MTETFLRIEKKRRKKENLNPLMTLASHFQHFLANSSKTLLVNIPATHFNTDKKIPSTRSGTSASI